MIILKPIGTEQTLKFIARVNTCDSVVLRDEQNNTSATIAASFTLDDPYITDDLIFSLLEGHSYNLTALNGEDIVYLDKIFCTAQTGGYSINDGEFTEHESTNEYITV